MRPVPAYHELHVVSDLHMGGVPGFQIFDLGDLLATVIEELRSKSPRKEVALVLNGDTVDFLAEPGARYFDPQGAVRMLERISQDPAFQPVWDALANFVSTSKRRLIINLGNHDLELALPWAQEWLLQRLSRGQERARARIRLVADGTGYLCRVGDARVLCVHGNEVDTFNVCDHEALRRQCRDGNMGRVVEPWTPNAGTKLVIDVMNEIKRQFPFVDLLKPEVEAVLPTLYALDPKAKPKLGEILGIAARLAEDRLRRLTGFLAEDDTSASGPDLVGHGEVSPDDLLHRRLDVSSQKTSDREADSLLAKAEEDVQRDRNPLEYVSDEGRARQLGLAEAAWDWLRGGTKEEVLREALKGLGRDRSFELDHADATFTQLDRWIGADIDFIVSGHTHLQRALPRRAGRGFYYNSGTWVRLIRLTRDVLQDPARFQKWYAAFQRGTMEGLDREQGLVMRKPAVVSITSEQGTVHGQLQRVRVAGGRDLLLPEQKSQFRKG